MEHLQLKNRRHMMHDVKELLVQTWGHSPSWIEQWLPIGGPQTTGGREV